MSWPHLKSNFDGVIKVILLVLSSAFSPECKYTQFYPHLLMKTAIFIATIRSQSNVYLKPTQQSEPHKFGIFLFETNIIYIYIYKLMTLVYCTLVKCIRHFITQRIQLP